jgi:hypothetical protein
LSTTNKCNKLNLFDSIFKFLFIAFWIISWFLGFILTDNKYTELSTSIFILYSSLCLGYMITYLTYINHMKVYEEKIEILYKLITFLTFIISTYSYYIVPRSMFWLFIKVILLIIYMYISILKVHKYKLEKVHIYRFEEGVVGILSSILLIFMLLRY